MIKALKIGLTRWKKLWHSKSCMLVRFIDVIKKYVEKCHAKSPNICNTLLIRSQDRNQIAPWMLWLEQKKVEKRCYYFRLKLGFALRRKVSKIQHEFMKSSFLPKYEPNIVRISALFSATLQGRNPYKIWFIFWEKRWIHKFILKFTDL